MFIYKNEYRYGTLFKLFHVQKFMIVSLLLGYQLSNYYPPQNDIKYEKLQKDVFIHNNVYVVDCANRRCDEFLKIYNK